MGLVTESLIEFQDTQLIDKLLLEGFNFSDLKKLKNPKSALDNLINKTNNTPKNSLRIKLIIAIIALIAYMSFPRNIIYKEQIKGKAVELAKASEIKRNDVYNATKELIQPTTQSPIILLDANKIKILNAIVPNRFNIKKIDQYNQYDKEIQSAVKELLSVGEKPNVKLIKAIMLVETGMKPKQNSLGYKGFPQTKMKFVKGINKRFKTNFTKADLYNAKQSAKFIHYMIKALKKSKFVKWDREVIAAYNWGLGNFSKYRIGKKKMPTETKNYVDMISVIIK